MIPSNSKPHRGQLLILILGMALYAPMLRAQQQADIVFYNGKVLTLSTDQGDIPVAEAVAVQAGKILAVGKSQDMLQLGGAATRKIDLQGRAMMPGLIDTHKHPNRDAIINFLKYLPKKYQKTFIAGGMIFDWRSKTQVLREVEQIARNADPEPKVVVISGRPIMGASGWGPTYLLNAPPPGTGESRGILIGDFANLKLTVQELDKASAGRAVIISLAGGGLMNSKAFAMAKQLFPNRTINVNRPCCLEALLGQPGPDVLAPLYKLEMEDKVAPLGYTTVSTRLSDDEIAGFGILDKTGDLQVRFGYAQQVEEVRLADFDKFVQRLKEVEQKYNSDMFWMTGLTGIPLDGSPDDGHICSSFPRLPGVADDYSFDSKSCYDWNKANDPKLEILRRLNRLGYRFSNMHSWANLAIENALTFYEELDKDRPLKGRRFAFDHTALLSAKAIQMGSKLGIMWSVAPLTGFGGQRAIMMRSVFGDEMVDAWGEPVRKILDAGMKPSFEAEFIAVDPWKGYQILVTRMDEFGKVRGQQNAVDRQTALRMMTRWGAEYVLRENKIGSIEPGKFADLIILDKNPLDPKLPDDRLETIRVLMTMVGGKLLYQHASLGW